jgi:hypothetical protein
VQRANLRQPGLVSQPWQSWDENGRRVLRLALIGGTMLASGILALRASVQPVIMVLGAAVLFAFVRWPAVGLIGLVVGTLTVPFAIGTGTETQLNIAAMLIGLLTIIWLLEMIRRREVRLVAAGPIAPLLALLAVVLVAFVAGAQPWLPFARTASLPAQIGGLALFFFSGAAFLLAAHLIRDVRQLQWLTGTFLATGAVHIAARLLPGGGELSRLLLGRDQLGSLFWVWLVALAFSQAVFNRALPALWRLALGALVAATLYDAIGYNRDWLAGWMPALVAIAVILLVGAPRLGPLLLASAGLVVLTNLARFAPLVTSGDNEYSAGTRLDAWRIMAEIIAINPLLGVGLSNYYWYTPLFPIRGYAVSFNSHNNYIDLAAQTGLLGLGCFLLFVVALGRLGWRLRFRAPEGFARAYVYGALGGLAGTLAAAGLGDWVVPFVYNIGYSGFRVSVLGWLFLGGLVALGQVITRTNPVAGASSVDH